MKKHLKKINIILVVFILFSTIMSFTRHHLVILNFLYERSFSKDIEEEVNMIDKRRVKSKMIYLMEYSDNRFSIASGPCKLFIYCKYSFFSYEGVPKTNEFGVRHLIMKVDDEYFLIMYGDNKEEYRNLNYSVENLDYQVSLPTDNDYFLIITSLGKTDDRPSNIDILSIE